jgi:hypothetical protein
MSFKRSDFANMTVAELKELLEGAGLATSGKKEQMVDRLVDAINEAIRDGYRSMTIAELKELLKASGHPLAGKKEDLVERLWETSSDRIVDDRPTSVAPPMAPPTARVSLPLELLPDNEFIVKDWGINPYDPTASYQGFRNLSQKEQKRLINALLESPRNSAINFEGVEYRTHEYDFSFMGCLYFNDWTYFTSNPEKLELFLLAYIQPSMILNWNTEQFITMVRRTGKGLLYMGRLPFGKEDSV